MEETPPVAISPDVLKWLQEAWRDEGEIEATVTAATGPSEDVPVETAGFDPFEFELCNGNKVKVVFAKFWERLTYQDRREGARPSQYSAIKVYSTEGTLPHCMALQCEFRADHEFPLSAVPKIWEWLGVLVDERQFETYDWLDEFLDELAEQINQFADEGEDVVEHYEHLPDLADPEVYDHDDSFFNDQNESGQTDSQSVKRAQS
jgi:hypothetical protein